MLDHFDSDDSWEPPEGDPFDFCYDNSNCSDESKAESLDVDSPHPEQSIGQTCSSSSESFRAAPSNPISCDIEGDSFTQVFSAPHTLTTSADFAGDKKRKQGMRGYQANSSTFKVAWAFLILTRSFVSQRQRIQRKLEAPKLSSGARKLGGRYESHAQCGGFPHILRPVISFLR